MPPFSDIVMNTLETKVERKAVARLELALLSSFGGGAVEDVHDRFHCTCAVERKIEENVREEILLEYRIVVVAEDRASDENCGQSV